MISQLEKAVFWFVLFYLDRDKILKKEGLNGNVICFLDNLFFVKGMSVLNNLLENNSETSTKMKPHVKIANALFSLENECLKMRDMAKVLNNQGDLESAKYISDKKEKYYSLLHHTYRYLYDIGWVQATGFYVQEFTSKNCNKKISQPLYELKLKKYKCYTIENISRKKFTDKDYLGGINGLFEIKNNQLFTCDEAVGILAKFTRCYYDENTQKYRTPSHLYRALVKYYSKNKK